MALSPLELFQAVMIIETEDSHTMLQVKQVVMAYRQPNQLLLLQLLLYPSITQKTSYNQSQVVANICASIISSTRILEKRVPIIPSARISDKCAPISFLARQAL